MTTSAPRVYSAPRRYDLATLLVVILAYSLLFTAIRLLRWEPGAALLTGVFITLVGLAQALLFGGKSPRLASVLTGAVYWPVCLIALEMFGHPIGVIMTVIWGSISGYFAGVLVGGVFLVAEALRRGRQVISSFRTRADKSSGRNGAEPLPDRFDQLE